MHLLGLISAQDDKKPEVTATQLPTNPKSWSVDDVQAWLVHKGLVQFKSLFLQEGVDGSTVLQLEKDDLTAMNYKVNKAIPCHTSLIVSSSTSLGNSNPVLEQCQ